MSSIDVLLDLLAYNWETIPAPDEFARWDEDDRVDHLVEFWADQRHFSELTRQASAGALSPIQADALSKIARLVADRRAEVDRLDVPENADLLRDEIDRDMLASHEAIDSPGSAPLTQPADARLRRPVRQDPLVT